MPSGIRAAGGFGDLLAVLGQVAGNPRSASVRPVQDRPVSASVSGDTPPAIEIEGSTETDPGAELLALLMPGPQPLAPSSQLQPQSPADAARAVADHPATVASAVPAPTIAVAGAATEPAATTSAPSVEPAGIVPMVVGSAASGRSATAAAPDPAGPSTPTSAAGAVAPDPAGPPMPTSAAGAVANAALMAAADPAAAADGALAVAAASPPPAASRPTRAAERARSAGEAVSAAAVDKAGPTPVAIAAVPAKAAAGPADMRPATAAETAAEAGTAATTADATGDPAWSQPLADVALPRLDANDDAVSTASPSGTAPAAAPPPAAQIAIQLARGVIGNAIVVSLSPRELGGVEIKLELDEDGRTRARIAVERPATLDLIQRDAPMLERALQAAGLSLAPNALSFDLRQDGHAPQQRREPQPWAGPAAGRQGVAESPAEPPRTVSRLLDLRV